MIDEEEELVEDFPGEMIAEVVDASEQRDLSYLHITIPRIDSIFEKNKKVSLYSFTYFLVVLFCSCQILSISGFFSVAVSQLLIKDISYPP